MTQPSTETDAFLRAVGRVTVAYGRLERHVAFLVQCLLSDNQRAGQTVTASMNFTPLIDLGVRLGKVRLTSADHQRALIALLDEAKSLADQRHGLIHAFLAPGNADGSHISLRMKARGREVLDVSHKVVRAEDLDHLADQMQQLVPRLYDYLMSLPQDITANYISRAD